MKTILISLVFAVSAFGATDVMRRNIKLPSQSVLQKQELTPAAADSDLILNDASFSSSAQTLRTFLAQPDFPRNLVMTPGSTTADVPAGSVVVSGRNANGGLITESFTFTANQTTAIAGNKAFAIIESIAIPAGDSPFGATLDVGTGDKLGLIKCLDGAGWFIKGLVDGANLTGETIAANSTAAESNTVIPNPAPNGSRKFSFLYVQNFRCDN